MEFTLKLPFDDAELRTAAPLRLHATITRRLREQALQEEAWLRGLMKKHHITKKELAKHCVIDHYVMPPDLSKMIATTVTLRINYTLWMKIKRWWRKRWFTETTYEQKCAVAEWVLGLALIGFMLLLVFCDGVDRGYWSF